MTTSFAVALCGFSEKDEHLLRIVLSRAPVGAWARFEIASRLTRQCDMALVDVETSAGMDEWARCRALRADLPAVCVSSGGTRGDSPFRLARAAMLLHLQGVLEQVAHELRAREHAPRELTEQPTSLEFTLVQARGDEGLGVEYAPINALVIDESPLVRTQIEAGLDRLGVRAVPVADSAAALLALRRAAFDLILLDALTPGLGGYEFCRELKRDRQLRSVPVLMLTSRQAPFDRARGLAAGCDNYIAKPIGWEILAGAVDRALQWRFHHDKTLLAARGYRAAPGGSAAVAAP